MLGEGIVCLGTAVLTVSDRKRKSSPKIVSETPSLPSTFSAAEVNSMPALLVAHLHGQLFVGLVDAVDLVDEVHVPRGAAELAVGGGLQADLLLHAHHVADGLVLDGAQLVGGAGRLGAPRADSRGASRLPTWSARNGGVSRWDMPLLYPSGGGLTRRRERALGRPGAQRRLPGAARAQLEVGLVAGQEAAVHHAARQLEQATLEIGRRRRPPRSPWPARRGARGTGARPPLGRRPRAARPARRPAAGSRSRARRSPRGRRPGSRRSLL